MSSCTQNKADTGATYLPRFTIRTRVSDNGRRGFRVTDSIGFAIGIHKRLSDQREVLLGSTLQRDILNDDDDADELICITDRTGPEVITLEFQHANVFVTA